VEAKFFKDKLIENLKSNKTSWGKIELVDFIKDLYIDLLEKDVIKQSSDAGDINAS
jgi:hypothetical protein